MKELSAFQRDILVILSGRTAPNGLDIKHELEEYYSNSVNHGRLYPNLNELVAAGLISKSEVDGRTNKYELTPQAEDEIYDRRKWERTHVSELRSGTALSE